MKRKYRVLKIENINYSYVIKNNKDGDGNNFVSIWKEGKKLIHSLKVAYGDVTPKTIKNIILDAKL